MSWFLSLLLAGSTAAGPSHAASAPQPAIASPHELLLSTGRRVRSPEPRLTTLMIEGVRRSRTFAELVAQVHRSDLIVYVESSPQLPADTLGRIRLQTIAGGQRYLRVQVRAMLTADQTIAVLGHELRHALEVAGDRSVVDDDGVRGLYRRIGRLTSGPDGYETEDARVTGSRVRAELIG